MHTNRSRPPIHLLFLACALVPLSFNSGCYAQRVPVDALAKLSGRGAFCRRAGDHRTLLYPGGMALLLHKDDVLRPHRRGGAVLFQPYSRPRVLPANSLALIQIPTPANGEDLLPPELFNQLVDGVLFSQQRLNDKSLGRRRGYDIETLTALSPRYEMIVSGRPRFGWTPVSNITSYKVSLFKVRQTQETPEPKEQVGPEEKVEQLWEVTTRRAFLDFPSERESLPPGRYRWQVITLQGVERLVDYVPFTVADGPQSTAIRASLDRARRLTLGSVQANLPLIAVCLKQGCYSLARKELLQALQSAPDDRVLLTLLAEIYRRTHLPDERDAVRKRLGIKEYPSIQVRP